ncbi:pyrimidine-nucleoside phosphorylase [Tepidibacillus fermentans]|uniref:Pyrimidine-nucleoside phosphorylase n=1 Tax=Tepidibacillus fermentans TaxID=1281767 RepID=A0A4R3KKR5_9BACI|nr:pyrimidine-nucleoside phosphorylase [Tepidibacillus fermentans]TCS84080.1 pyrimidine-nucleoside phosphorylase [Tepidibacillus fermentans]
MRMVDIIHKKRDGGELTKEEIHFFIEEYTKGKIPDYQVSALLMAIYFRGMTADETAMLTMAMVNSGDTIDLSGIHGHKVDKHSTGGVGDKTSLIVAPLVASVGVPVAKMSGRGLGHTGGTIDKLESIAGFQVEMSKEEFIANVNQYKIAIAGQTGNLAPADKKLYALRDVTATVDSIPLIASSIMSKKIASGADSIVLDVKTGSGAFMKTLEDSEALAKEMVRIGKKLGRNTVAIISDMNQPLGFEVGNANEIKEVIRVLRGENVEDLKTLSLELAVQMVLLAGRYPYYETAKMELEKNLINGEAYQCFKQFIRAQHGNTEMVDHIEKLPDSKYHIEVKAEQNGYIAAIDAEAVGIAAMYLGAGRTTKEDQIDHSVGVTLKKKVGDEVTVGDTIAILHSNQENPFESVQKLREAYGYSKEQPLTRPLIYNVIK